MKKLFSILTMLFLVATFATAQNDKPVAPAAGPSMVFEKTEMDYGTINKGADPLRIFKFKNTGTEPLVIKNARGSCGCTVPNYKKEPIMPGENGEVEVRYDTQRVGQFTKTVTIETNEENGTRILTIKGEVKDVVAAPGVPTSAPSVISAPK
jgi:hypothetical protein